MVENRTEWLNALKNQLFRRERRHLVRHRIQADAVSATEIEIDGNRLVNFGSNDYLGLARHSSLWASSSAGFVLQDSDKWSESINQHPIDEGSEAHNRGFSHTYQASSKYSSSWGSSASPLVTGRGYWLAALESRIAEFEACESAIVFPSGFAANLGTVSALCRRGDLVFSDALNHASLIDGCRLSRAKNIVYPHVDMVALESLLLKQRESAERAFLVTDTIFSMDGDSAPLVQLVALANRFDLILIVDEAHATGVYGAHGRGLCEAMGVEDQVDVRIGTLSKAVGSLGGFVVGPKVLIDWLVNFARTYIYSTALPPATCAASIAAFEWLENAGAMRDQLRASSIHLRQLLAGDGWRVGRGDSPIIPIYVGDSETAIRLSKSLYQAGFFVPAIRPPSVPLGQALLRISLSVTHTLDQIQALRKCLSEIK